jgi:hypothetical protein
VAWWSRAQAEVCIVIKEDGPGPVGQILLDSKHIGFRSTYTINLMLFFFAIFIVD